MSRQDYQSIAKYIRQFRDTYDHVLTPEMKFELGSMLSIAKNGDKSYGELLEKLREYEAYFGHKISNEYNERKYRQ